MIFDAKSFLRTYNVQSREHGKNWQKGWLQINCPFCGDVGFHGGFKVATGSFNCWRCKFHKTKEVISKLLRIPENSTYPIIKQFLILGDLDDRIHVKRENRPTTLELPEGTNDLKRNHINYLLDRNYDPEEIQRLWDIKGTGIHGSYKFRIIVPIYLNGVLVSYQGRDVTNEASERYKACKLDDEVVPHKNMLYGIDKVKSTAIVVEGITDVWRIGYGATATFGTEYTPGQINLLASLVDKAVLLFDHGAEEDQEKLAADLIAVGVEVVELSLDSGDPGDLDDLTVNDLKKDFLNS